MNRFCVPTLAGAIVIEQAFGHPHPHTHAEDTVPARREVIDCCISASTASHVTQVMQVGWSMHGRTE